MSQPSIEERLAALKARQTPKEEEPTQALSQSDNPTWFESNPVPQPNYYNSYEDNSYENNSFDNYNNFENADVHHGDYSSSQNITHFEPQFEPSPPTLSLGPMTAPMAAPIETSGPAPRTVTLAENAAPAQVQTSSRSQRPKRRGRSQSARSARIATAGASVVSFGAMVVAMGPLVQSDDSDTTTDLAAGSLEADPQQDLTLPDAPAVTISPLVGPALVVGSAVSEESDPNSTVTTAALTIESAPSTQPAVAADTDPASPAPPPTQAPATSAAPVTQAPQPTNAPAPSNTTAAPATAAPTTAAPTTAAPTTAAPTTAPPKSEGSG